MVDHNPQLIEMITQVALAMGDELRKRTAFVGGATTGLFVTDEFALSQVRFTDDVDLIVDILGYGEWPRFLEELRIRGFRESIEDDVICRMRLEEIKVDFMPDDEAVLGFSNRWYKAGLETASEYSLSPDLVIRILQPPLFIATKLEAYLGRGADDPMMSHDLEDILILVDGRKELVSEVKIAPMDIQLYIASQFQNLLENDQFDFALEGNFRGDSKIIGLVRERMKLIIQNAQ